VIYLASGLCGSLLSIAMNPGPSIGASGAIFGVSGAVIVFLYKYQSRFFIRDKRVGFVLLIWSAYTVATGFLSPEIDNFAHIGGFIGGALLGALLPLPPRAGSK
jgi:rhomboid protease GluP